MGRKKQVEPICGNCKLYDGKSGMCQIVILMEGRRVKLPVDPDDSCFYQENGYFDPTTKATEDFTDEIKEVKFWVEDKEGKKTKGNGVVKMEFPEGFFGEYENGIFGFPDIEVANIDPKNPPPAKKLDQ